MKHFAVILFALVLTFSGASAKIFSVCSLVKTLRSLGVPENEIADWVCIAKYKSNFNSKFVAKNNSNGSHDFGIFLINNKYWCGGDIKSPNVCNVPCNRLLSDNIAPSVKCARFIKSRRGFRAWAVWQDNCQKNKPICKEYLSFTMGSENREFIVRYKNDVYDLSKFILKHPGGVNTLMGLHDSEMTNRFLKAPPHSDAAMYLLKEYQIKGDVPYRIGNQKSKKDMNKNAMIIEENIGIFKEDQRMKKDPEIVSNNNNCNNFSGPTDDSMEHIVDWSKAMVPQIRKISDQYSDWVNKPVDRPLRLFEPWYLEMNTKTPWWVIPVFWIPVAAYLIYQECFTDQKLHLEISIAVIHFLSGILLWTFLEYVLHRWIFHMGLKGKHPWLCTLHFLIHGLHHKVPFDQNRLVFPVLPAILIATVLYIVCCCLLAMSKITLAGTICGYVCYDLIHYYLHYGDPTLSLIYNLKRCHYQHHFAHHNRGFGVSSSIWDFVFGTRIFLRKLGFMIRWRFSSA